MALPSLQPRRTIDVVCNTIVSVAIALCATALALKGTFDTGSVLAAFTLSAAASGLPIVIKRDETPAK